ncbi:MAG: metallophosphoesterase [Candidatus Puniceispirillaceae bacterium]
MVRFAIFSVIAFIVAYGLYVYPGLALISLFFGTNILDAWALAPTLLVFLLLRLYLATDTTNSILKAFVYYGMGIGFLSALVVSVLVIVKETSGADGTMLGIIAVLAIAMLVGYSVFNANRIVHRELTFSSEKIGRPTRFAFISDVHIGSNPPRHLQKICDELDACEIEALFIGGDLFDSSDFQLEDIENLRTLETDIYFVTGNHEGYVKGHEALLGRFTDLNIRVLDNEAADLGDVRVIGVADKQPSTARVTVIESLHSEIRYNIALVHQPSIWRRTEAEIDLMLCGHTHNGQIFPFNLLVRLQFRHIYGLYRHGMSNLYVSSGVGCWGPRLRLGSRNEIVTINLEPAPL